MEQEFSLIAFLTSSTSQVVWYIENGESFHIIAVREYLFNYNEEEIRFYIQMGNNFKCNLV